MHETPHEILENRTPARGCRRLLLAVGLALLAPVCAEYLTGYDDLTGDPALLLFGLLFLAPLYGGPALLIREAARRFGVGWPGILALAAAFGFVQAGIIDQSLFSSNYRDIDYWGELVGPTWIEPLGFGASPMLGFVAGHMIWSYTAPIAMVESLRPDLARRPWLRTPGLVVTALLYLASATLILRDHLRTESDHASAAQIIGTGAVALALAAFALTVGRRKAPKVPRRVPPPWALVVLAVLAAFTFGLSTTWVGFAYSASLLVLAGFGIAHCARSTRWRPRHVIALATGALLADALTGFLVTPLGDVDSLAKYLQNAVLVAGVVALGWLAMRRNRD
jgi:hypothetical protein